MQTTQLGNSDLQITAVGFGAWALGGSGWQFAWGEQNDEDSVGAIHRALAMGREIAGAFRFREGSRLDHRGHRGSRGGRQLY